MKYLIGWLLLNLFAITALNAEPLTPAQVPEPLKPWVSWVLQDVPDRDCPFIYNQYDQKWCNWPTDLNLALTNKTGKFSSLWEMHREGWAELPGDSKNWPQNVTVNNKEAPVMEINGKPAVKLPAGSHTIAGDFFWRELPNNLSIPQHTGLIDLSVNGAPIRMPDLKDAQLWLQADQAKSAAANVAEQHLEVQVFRKIIDEVPMQMVTRLELEVAGLPREVKLPLAVLKDFVPVAIQSALPTRLEPDGQLSLQVRAGHWDIEVTARSVAELNSITLTEPAAEDQVRPHSEIWVFEARPDLRMAEVSDLAAIDPSQTKLPPDWQNFPAYSLNAGQTMNLNVIRRGDTQPEPNQLTLQRRLWLDFAGTGYTINDRITGTMTSTWRLNALPETQLGKVTLDGNNQLITQDAAAQQGVEVRKGLLDLAADSRKDGAIQTLNAVGWAENFHQVSAQLNLPPGWRLLGATGVDNVPDSWLARWTLLDLFEVLIAALAISRLWDIRWGLIALLTLVLIWHEADAPHFIWLNILAVAALLRVIPKGRFYKLMQTYQVLSWVLLALLTLPFMVQQLRTGLHPQLEFPWQSITQAAPEPLPSVAPAAAAPGDEMAPMQAMEAPPAPEVAKPMRKAMRAEVYEAQQDSSKSGYAGSMDFNRIDPKAKVQTGPGLPLWQWRTVELSWNGPINSDQQVRLWYLNPTMNLLLNFLRVALVAVMSLLLFGVTEKINFRLKNNPAAWLWLLLMPGLCSFPDQTYAQFPDQTLLDNLKAKLLEAPDCLPGCAEIPHLQITITEQTVTISFLAHAQQAVAIPLPAAYQEWYPQQVSVDGAEARGLYRDGDKLWLKLNSGTHHVVLTGETPLLNKFILPLPLKPRWITLDSTTWQLTGLDENSQADGQLQLNRIQQAAPQNQPTRSQLPPFLKLERTLQLGLDWRVINRVSRVSAADSAVVLQIPLLKGEAVTTPGIRVKDGKVEVNMTAAAEAFEWTSTLDKSAVIELQADPGKQWFEVWRADISPIWHVLSSGIPAMYQNSQQQWLPEWHPWPAETLKLELSRPEAIAGQTLTIDQSQLKVNPGQRSQQVELNLSLRSSQGTQHTLVLPEQAVLQSVSIDGENRAIRLDNRKLTVPITPGPQNIAITWQEAKGITTVFNTPEVNLGIASANSNISVGLGEDRWVLLTKGPRFGPAVLFWGVLLVIALLAAGLHKMPVTPLKHWQWFLLLVGLSQIPLVAAGIVIGWLLLLGWRARNVIENQRVFNLLQVMLVLLTLGALGLLFYAVAQGLLSHPDMQIAGNQSSAFLLNWYQDRASATLPETTVVSLSLTWYRVLMLLWSLWLAVALLDWLKWGWQAFSANGLWRKSSKIALPATNATINSDTQEP